MAEGVADDRFMWTMEKDAAFPEQFRDPLMKDLTANARDVAIQLRNAYNSGDKEVKKAINEFERERMRPYANERTDLEKHVSGDKLSKSTAWELFYQAHQRYIGHALEEKHDMHDYERDYLQSWHGLDMGGSKLFDFHSLIGKGKLNPKGID